MESTTLAKFQKNAVESKVTAGIAGGVAEDKYFWQHTSNRRGQAHPNPHSDEQLMTVNGEGTSKDGEEYSC